MPGSGSTITRRANEATAGELAVSVPSARTIRDRNFSFSVKTTSDVCDDERDEIWQIFEENMYELYCSSSFGWNPQKKRKEMFNKSSRFIIAHDSSDQDNLASSSIIAFAIFRFVRECGQDVVYCYELHVLENFRRFGLGKLLVHVLSDIGALWNMTKLMLTVCKANHTALLFYKSTGFTIDEMSPEFDEDPESESKDYSILSKRI